MKVIEEKKRIYIFLDNLFSIDREEEEDVTFNEKKNWPGSNSINWTEETRQMNCSSDVKSWSNIVLHFSSSFLFLYLTRANMFVLIASLFKADTKTYSSDYHSVTKETK